MPNTLTPNMNLILPTVGQEPGPEYATDVNNSLSLIDQHNHAAGNGVAITPSGLNISSDLSFLSNNAVALRTIRFTPQPMPISLGTDLGCLYEAGVDLYYNDGNGNQIQLTQNGSIAGASGSIVNLVSPASVVLTSGTFVFQSNTNTPGALDIGPLTIRTQTTSPNGITINSPNALASNYSLTLFPALPGSQSFVTVDSSGNLGTIATNSQFVSQSNLLNNSVGTPQLITNSVTPAILSAPNYGQAQFNSSGSTTSLTPVILGSLAVSITASGVRPVLVTLSPSPSNAGSYILASGGGNNQCFVEIHRDDGTNWSSEIGTVATANGTYFSPSMINFIDLSPSAGVRTYTLYGYVNSNAGSTTLSYKNLQLLVYEL